MFIFKSKKKDPKPTTYEGTLRKEVALYDELQIDMNNMIRNREEELEWIKKFQKDEQELLEKRIMLKKELENRIEYCRRAGVVSKFIFQNALHDDSRDIYSLDLYSKDFEAISKEKNEIYEYLLDTESRLEHVVSNIRDSEKQIDRCNEDICLIQEQIQRQEETIESEAKKRADTVREIEEDRQYRKELAETMNSTKQRR